MEKEEVKNIQQPKNTNLALMIGAIIAVVATIIYAIAAPILYSKYQTIGYKVFAHNISFIIPIVIADVILVISYIKHNKNLTKALIGFILCGLLMMSAHYAFSYYDRTQWYFVVKVVLFALIVIFTINQYLLSSNHYSRPLVLFINQQIVVILTIISVAAGIVNCIKSKENPILFITLLIFMISSMLIVLEIEMKINNKKVIRQEKGFVFEKIKDEDVEETKEDKFISNGYFYSLPGIVAIGLILLIIFNGVFDQVITWGYSIRYLFYLIKIICLVFAIIDYKRHSFDVLKVMLGFLVGTLLFENLFECSCLASSNITSVKSIATIVMVFVNALFIIAHMLLTKTGAKNKKIVTLMKVAYLAYVILAVVVAADCSISYFIGKGNNYVWFMFKPILWLLGTFPVITGIVTIDSRVNGLKLTKEKEEALEEKKDIKEKAE